MSDHPAEIARRLEQIRKSELLAKLDRLNIQLLDHGVAPKDLAVDLEDKPLQAVVFAIARAEHILKPLKEQ